MKAAVIAASIFAALIALLFGTSGPDPDSVPTAEEVAGRTMSPFCEGLTLNECPHSKSTALRAQIESMIGEGATNREIDEWMERNYGIASQGRPGAGLAWLAPPGLAILGLIAVIAVIRGRKAPPTITESPAVELSDADEARFTADFQGYTRGSE